MLQKINNAWWSFVSLESKTPAVYIKLYIGKSTFNVGYIIGEDRIKYINNCIQKSDVLPFGFKCQGESYWFFRNNFYKDTDNLKANEVAALLITRDKLKKQRINNARTIATLVTQPEKVQRSGIPDDVRLLVWERDDRKCQKCGSRVELQYDHIIPVSLGGANTPENLQILCGRCNRLKSASVV